MNTRILPALLLAATLPLTACGSADEDSADAPSEAASESTGAAASNLYNQARDKLDEGSHKSAISDFEEVERRYPYSDLAIRSQVMAGYTAYKAEEYDQAVSILERYVRMHPGDTSVPYAYYLIALCSYEQISDVGRDQKMTEHAMDALTEVIRRFPRTDYARDAKLKLDLTIDHLAGKEMEIGRYYQSRNEFLAAINRFRFVVENYQTTSHIPEALHRLTETYTAIGLDNEARRYAAVLGHNYPSSIWYRDTYQLATGEEVDIGHKEDEGWLDWVTPALVAGSPATRCVLMRWLCQKKPGELNQSMSGIVGIVVLVYVGQTYRADNRKSIIANLSYNEGDPGMRRG